MSDVFSWVRRGSALLWLLVGGCAEFQRVAEAIPLVALDDSLKEVITPDVRGLERSQAQKRLEDAHLGAIGWLVASCGLVVQPGFICQTEPAAGVVVAVGTPIRVHVQGMRPVETTSPAGTSTWSQPAASSAGSPSPTPASPRLPEAKPPEPRAPEPKRPSDYF